MPNIYSAYLQQANLMGADLRGTNLTDANLVGADLRAIIFEERLREAPTSTQSSKLNKVYTLFNRYEKKDINSVANSSGAPTTDVSR